MSDFAPSRSSAGDAQASDGKDRYFEFVQEQMKRDRNFFKHLYIWTAVVAGLLFFVVHVSVNVLRNDMKAEVSKTQSQVSERLSGIDANLQRKIDQEFRSGDIANLIATAARERTEKEISEIVRAELSAQLARSLLEQPAAMQQTAEGQTVIIPLR
jgi:hypothetical protein